MLVGAWSINRFDPIFHNRQDVELVRLHNNGTVTRISNETEADPVLGGAFIGDYLEVTANRGRAWVHYNANERHVALLGKGLPIPSRTTTSPGSTNSSPSEAPRASAILARARTHG